MALGTTHMTITTKANFIPELWGPNIISATERKLVFRNLVWDWSSPVKGKGDTIRAPNVSNMTSNPKVASTQVVLNATTN